jgi:hypothetical protein
MGRTESHPEVVAVVLLPERRIVGGGAGTEGSSLIIEWTELPAGETTLDNAMAQELRLSVDWSSGSLRTSSGSFKLETGEVFVIDARSPSATVEWQLLSHVATGNREGLLLAVSRFVDTLPEYAVACIQESLEQERNRNEPARGAKGPS